ncbi:MAG: ATP-binding protein [Saprospiraceae bacterium]|nr:ATP-binding protein [Saprospiraceae bacterium]
MKKNIVFMGAPSSGKTTLCKFLANHFDEPWMPELGKQYWIDNQLNRRLTQKQLLEIAQLHILGEDKNMEDAKKFLFTDTNSITTYMFALDYYGQVDAELTELARQAEHRYDHFFVCDIDIPYEDTWERSGEVYRTRFQQLILDDLTIRGIKYTILSGDIQTRVAKVLSIL